MRVFSLGPALLLAAAAFAVSRQRTPVRISPSYRSDHFSLARVGVPAFSVAAGNKFAGHHEAWGEAQAKDFVAHRYHQPNDEYRPEMDFPANARIAQVAFALGWRAARRMRPINWHPGDEFERVRKRSRQAH